MANSRISNTIYIDTANDLLLDSVGSKVAGILFTSNGAGDEMVLKETSGGDPKVHLKIAAADQSQFFDFSTKNMVFSQGIYVATLSSGAVATLILG